ncbi:ABC transporter permease subunit [Labrenzia sp. CE80]|uniref:ABC transporter permease n=1 Tax=Labrenzia sp. CE80 TaxID=1788986 RepID=UPI00129ADF49|nr:ABC transporter permease subunit [Labrenzia sp. CE80]
MLFVLALIAIGFFWQPHDPHAIDLSQSLQAPSWDHWLGTDHLGRDLASRLIVGAQSSVFAIAIVLVSSFGIGVVAGAAIAIGPWSVSATLRWLAETVLTVPTFVLALLLAALFGAGLMSIAAALIVVTWAPYALSLAALFDRLRGEQYWQASLALGAGLPGALHRHMLPNTLPVLGALAGADAGRAVILVASLGFLGLSADTGHPEWGAMIHEYRMFLFSEPRLVLAPVCATTVLAFLLNRALDRNINV